MTRIIKATDMKSISLNSPEMAAQISREFASSNFSELGRLEPSVLVAKAIGILAALRVRLALTDKGQREDILAAISNVSEDIGSQLSKHLVLDDVMN